MTVGSDVYADPSVKKAQIPLLENLAERLTALKERLENIAGRSESLSSRLIGPMPPLPTAVDEKATQRCGALVGAMETTIEECDHFTRLIAGDMQRLEDLG